MHQQAMEEQRPATVDLTALSSHSREVIKRREEQGMAEQRREAMEVQEATEEERHLQEDTGEERLLHLEDTQRTEEGVPHRTMELRRAEGRVMGLREARVLEMMGGSREGTVMKRDTRHHFTHEL